MQHRRLDAGLARRNVDPIPLSCERIRGQREESIVPAAIERRPIDLDALHPRFAEAQEVVAVVPWLEPFAGWLADLALRARRSAPTPCFPSRPVLLHGPEGALQSLRAAAPD